MLRDMPRTIILLTNFLKQGISTYDYIVALREQEQELEGGGGQQSPQMSMISSFTGLSSASSFNAFHRGAWCTPPRLFVEDQVSCFFTSLFTRFSCTLYNIRPAGSCSSVRPKSHLVEPEKVRFGIQVVRFFKILPKENNFFGFG